MSQTEQRLLLKCPTRLHVTSLPWGDLPPAELKAFRGRRLSPSEDNRGMRWGLMPISVSGRGGSPASQSKAVWTSPLSLKSEPQSPRQLQMPFEFQKAIHPNVSAYCSPKASSPSRNSTEDLLFRKRLRGHRYAVELNSRVRIRGIYRSQPRLRPLLCRV